MKTLLFNPGPTNISSEVRNSLITADMSHRESDFTEVLCQVNKTLVEILGGSGTHSSIMLVSSGTGANEAIINCIHGKILAINHGRYATRLCDIARTYNIPIHEYKIPELEPINLETLETILQNDKEITHIMLVHHETTTGMLEPLYDIGQLAKKYNKLIVVDGVSSVGGHDFDLQRDNVAFCGINANKCLESLPGISFVLARNDELSKLKGMSRSFYFDLYSHWIRQSKNEVIFTAAVQLVFAMNVALQRLKKEGYANRVKRYKKLAEHLRNGITNMGFELIPFPAQLQSNILTLIKLPENMNYQDIHDKLYHKGITIYSDSNSLKNGRFFIATMGAIDEEDVNYFLKTFELTLKELNIHIKS